MDNIKKKLAGFAFIFAMGIAFFILGILRGGNSILVGIGVGYMISSAIRFMQYYKISKNEQKKKEYEIMQREERFVFLADKSRSLAYILMLNLEFIGGVIALLLERENIAMLFFYIGIFQILIYVICYRHFSKKY